MYVLMVMLSVVMDSTPLAICVMTFFVLERGGIR